VEISASQFALVAAVGVIAGIINGTVGGGSLLTYPLLVWIGVPPVIAAATNTTGLSTGNLFALIAHRDGSLVKFGDWRKHAVSTAAGAVVGGLLLILLPEKIFTFIVPVFLVAASIVMLLKPKASDQKLASSAHTMQLLFAGGIYNGYFGPGQGVIAMAVLLRDGRLTMAQVVVVKNFVLAASNVIVASLFIITGHVLWPVALTLLASVAAGGWAGGHLAGRINQLALRWSVAVIGFASAAWFVWLR